MYMYNIKVNIIHLQHVFCIEYFGWEYKLNKVIIIQMILDTNLQVYITANCTNCNNSEQFFWNINSYNEQVLLKWTELVLIVFYQCNWLTVYDKSVIFKYGPF